MTAVDTSVVVAAFAMWHEGHRAARRAIRREPSLPAHVALETYSVLTRLPPPHRVAPEPVHAFLRDRFSNIITLSRAGHRLLLARAEEHRISGGAVYDALVGATAVEAGVLLLTRDRRAIQTYELVGAAYELIA